MTVETFKAEGVLHTMRSENGSECLCCEGRHVFAYGVEVLDAPQCAQDATGWLHSALYPLRMHDGARVRIIVEVEHDG